MITSSDESNKDIQNYRVTFGGEDIDWKVDFHKCRKYFDIVEEIITLAQDVYDIEYIWWFFEPYVEITWIDDVGDFIEVIRKKLNGMRINYQVHTPEDGFFAEWFGQDVKEHIFGFKRYAAVAQLSRLLLSNKELIENGMGWEKQYIRCCHALACQIGLNHRDEGMAMLKRALFCLTSHYGDYNGAVKLYDEIFDEWHR